MMMMMVKVITHIISSAFTSSFFPSSHSTDNIRSGSHNIHSEGLPLLLLWVWPLSSYDPSMRKDARSSHIRSRKGNHSSRRIQDHGGLKWLL